MTILNNIDNSYTGYQQLIDFYHEHKDKRYDKIDLELEFWFAANMSTALGGILDLLNAKFNKVIIGSIQPDIEKILLKNKFLSYFGHASIIDDYQTTIKFQKLNPTDGKFFNNYVMNELLDRSELPKMSELVKQKIAEKIYEIFVNAQIHSKSKHIYTCGQFYPRKNTIEFTIVDMGIGFKKKINERFGWSLDAVQAIKWATKDRHTTKIDVPGGIGLALLKEFVTLNKGFMHIVSDNGFYQFDANGEQMHHFTRSFPGTIVNLQFRTDDTGSYALKEEIDLNNIF